MCWSHSGYESSPHFAADKAAYDLQLVAAKGRQAQHQSKINESERLSAELQRATEKETIQGERVAKTSEAVSKFNIARDVMRGLVKQRYDLLKTTSEEIREKSNGALKARAKRDAEPAEYVDAVKSLVEASRLRDVDALCSEWVKSAVTASEGASWENFCVELIEIYKNKIIAGMPTEVDANSAERIRRLYFQGAAQLTPQMIGRLFANLTDQTVATVLSATSRDTIYLTYVSSGRDIDFRDASPGQQASALLRLLLRQKAGTLIIDQPEDDLDNRVLMEIVEMMRASKCQRQLIFATHNPNLVVKGDADKVVVMHAAVPEDRPASDEARFSIEIDGSIETPNVRKAITGIMEGGKDAFDLRARKYGTLPNNRRIDTDVAQ